MSSLLHTRPKALSRINSQLSTYSSRRACYCKHLRAATCLRRTVRCKVQVRGFAWIVKHRSQGHESLGYCQVSKKWGEVTAVIAGLTGTYTGYITTWEEYQEQRFEAAATAYGPHTLDAYVQVQRFY